MKLPDFIVELVWTSRLKDVDLWNIKTSLMLVFCLFVFFLAVNSPLLVLTRFCAEQKRSEVINATSNIRKHRFAGTQKLLCINFDEISGEKLDIFSTVFDL